MEGLKNIFDSLYTEMDNLHSPISISEIVYIFKNGIISSMEE